MRKTILKSLLTIACLLCSITIYAYDFEVDGIYYDITDETEKTGQVSVQSSWGHSLTGSVIIPNSVTYQNKTYSVTSICDYAFQGADMTEVTIPNSITSIGNGAFIVCINLKTVNFNAENCTYMGSLSSPVFDYYNHTYLTTVNIGESVKTIPNYAFSNCKDLTKITIPNSVTSIGDYAFYLSYLTEVTIGNSVTSIGDYAFYGTEFEEVTLPNNVTSIGDYAFHSAFLTEVTIPKSVTSIGNGAFGNNVFLTTVNFNAENCTYMGSSSSLVFDECSDLTTINIGESVKTIPNYAFSNCKNLTKITIPNSVTSIGDYAFEGCSDLNEITIPNSVTSIGKSAFKSCYVLRKVIIGNNVTSIGSSAFAGCNRLEGVYITDLSAWCRIEFSSGTANPLYNAHNLYLNNELVTSLVIPEDVTSIVENAFYRCTGLTEITIPNSVTSIGDCAFCDCTGLTEVTIPNSVTSIGNSAFDGCTGLKEVTIGNSVTSIGDCAFYECTGLTEVTIPNSVTSIGSSAFAKCADLTSIEVEKNNTVYDSQENCNAIIDKATNTLVVGCQNTIIPNSVTKIGNSAFRGCTGLTEITIPNSVTSIGDFAFESCSGLKEITIPNSVTSIGDYAFIECTGLTTLICEATLPPTIGYDIFWGADADIYISYRSSDAYKSTSWGNLNLNFITQIIDDVCYVVTNIADREAGITGVADKGVCTVVLPDSILQDSILHDTFRVTSIETEAFKDCIDLDEIVVSNSVEYIGNSAFDGCSGLRTVTIGRGVTEIGENTFAGCDRIKTVNCYAQVPPTIYSHTFTVYVNDNANLHVVNGSKEAYADANYWKYFMNITDDLTAGVEDITCDNVNAPIEYYDLNGFRIENPTRGIYIMKQGSTVKKVVLKN